MCCTPSLEHSSDHTADVNCVPLSDVMVEGVPKRLIHVLMRAWAQVCASMLRRGTASNHLVDRAIIVKR